MDSHCSHPFYIGKKVRPPWLSIDLALSYFGKQEMSRENEFNRFIESGVPEEVQKALESKRWPALLGGKEFTDCIRKRFVVEPQKSLEKPQEKPLRQILSREEIIKKVCLIYQVHPAHLRDRTRKDIKMGRKAAIFFLRHKGHLTYKEIGNLLGGLTHGPIARVCQQVQSSMEPEFQQLQCELEFSEHKKG
jgi:chromosomal replication initiation ATPase DnaA